MQSILRKGRFKSKDSVLTQIKTLEINEDNDFYFNMTAQNLLIDSQNNTLYLKISTINDVFSHNYPLYSQLPLQNLSDNLALALLEGNLVTKGLL